MVAREAIRSVAHPWFRLNSKRSTSIRSKITTGSTSFKESSARKTSPEPLVKSAMASATWLLVGCLVPAAMIMLFLASNGAPSTLGAGDGVGESFSTLARADVVFRARSELEGVGDRSSTNVAVPSVLFEFAVRGATG